jgi:hypothetical protein
MLRRPAMRRPDRRPIALAAAALAALLLGLSGCGLGDPTQVGLEPTRDWPDETECPPTLAAVCGSKRLTIVSTINEPQGTTYGISSSNEDVFVVCRWPAGAQAATCEEIPPAGARVVGEAAVYRVEG